MEGIDLLRFCFLSRFCLNGEGRKDKKFRSLEVREASSSHLKILKLIVFGRNLEIPFKVGSVRLQRKACMRKTGRMQIESRVGVEIRLEGWLVIGILLGR